jgi:hypothetical protein
VRSVAVAALRIAADREQEIAAADHTLLAMLRANRELRQ